MGLQSVTITMINNYYYNLNYNIYAIMPSIHYPNIGIMYYLLLRSVVGSIGTR